MAAAVATASVLVASPPVPAAADCGLQPRERYTTTGSDGAPAISSVFFGTVLSVRRPAWRAQVVIRTERLARGIPSRTLTFDGMSTCGSVTLTPGRRYLFAAAPEAFGVDGSLAFETDGPAWRWVVTGGQIQPLLDDRAAPTDPAALLRFLRERVVAGRAQARTAVAALDRASCDLPTPRWDPGAGTWAQVRLQPAGEMRSLTVGTLGGESWLALRDRDRLRISGPVRGRVLAWSIDAGRPMVELVDIRRHTVRSLGHLPRWSTGVTLDRTGCTWYWLRRDQESWQLRGRTLAASGRPITLIGRVWAPRARLVQSIRGRWLAIEGPRGWRSRVIVDLATGSFRWSDRGPADDLLPLMGRRAVTIVRPVRGEGRAVLRSVDPWTGRGRRLGTAEPGHTEVVAGRTGPLLAWIRADAGAGELVVAGADGTVRRIVPLPESVAIVMNTAFQGVEAPGWVSITPGGVVMPDGPAAGIPWLLTDPSTGRRVEMRGPSRFTDP